MRLSATCIGMITNDYQISALIQDINKGFANMQDIFILSLFIGGLSELVRQQGGLSALTAAIKSFSAKLSKHKERSAGIGIASLAFVCNFLLQITLYQLSLLVKLQKI